MEFGQSNEAKVSMQIRLLSLWLYMQQIGSQNRRLAWRKPGLRSLSKDKDQISRDVPAGWLDNSGAVRCNTGWKKGNVVEHRLLL